MTEGRFPYPLVLVTIHQFAITLFSCVLFHMKPSLYRTVNQVKENKFTAFKIFVPLSLFFSFSCVLSNAAFVWGIQILTYTKKNMDRRDGLVRSHSTN
jgi:hypothetical protein